MSRPLTVSGALELLRRQYELEGRASARKVRAQTARMVEVIGSMELAALTTSHIVDYQSRRIAQAAPKTVNLELGLLHRGMEIARDRGLLEHIPRWHALPVQNARTGFLDRSQWGELRTLLELRDPAVADLVEWLWRTGWRREEARGLQWQEVDLRARLLQLPARRVKSRAIRTLPLAAGALQLLRERRRERNGPLVFHRHGRPLGEFRATWKGAVADLGRPELHLHDLRRSFARSALLAGVPQPYIMALAGWRTASVFRRYAIVDETALAQAVERIDQYLEQ